MQDRCVVHEDSRYLFLWDQAVAYDAISTHGSWNVESAYLVAVSTNLPETFDS